MHPVSIIFGLIALILFWAAFYFKDGISFLTGMIVTIVFVMTLALQPLKTTVSYESIPTEHIIQAPNEVFIVHDRGRLEEIKDLEVYKAVKNGIPIAWKQTVKTAFFGKLKDPVKLVVDPNNTNSK